MEQKLWRPKRPMVKWVHQLRDRLPRFAMAPHDPADGHRQWKRGPLALDEALTRREECVLSKALTFSAKGTRYCVKTAGAGIAMRGARVTLGQFLDGSLQVSHKGRLLACTAFRQPPRPSHAENEKTIDAGGEAVIAACDLTAAAPRSGKRGCG